MSVDLSASNETVLSVLLEKVEKRSKSVQDFWRFLMVCFNTPRPSTNYDDIEKPERSLPFRSVMRELCSGNNLLYREDSVGNMIITNSPGKDALVCFQGHMDVVVSKNESESHDFDTQGVDVWVTKEGTVKPIKGITLGADNGVAIAAGLAVLVNYPSLPMELLVTTNEETNFAGACGLDASLISARRILNLDSEVENAICVGSAGGFEHHFRLPTTCSDPNTEADHYIHYSVKIKDLKGGHSGIDIAKGKTNAIFAMLRLLLTVRTECPFRLVKFSGGSSTNAIPRECSVTIACCDPHMEECLRANFAIIKLDIALVEDSVCMQIRIDEETMKSQILCRSSTNMVLNFLSALPNGVVRTVGNDVESSLNLGIAKLDEGSFVCKYLVRSTSTAWMHFYAKQLSAIGDLAGAASDEMLGIFGAWEPIYVGSDLVDTIKKAHKGTPEVYTVHAGLECSTIIEKFHNIGKQVECASIGPQINHAHSPDECLFIDSANNFVELIEDVIVLLK